MWIVMTCNDQEPPKLFHGFRDEKSAMKWAAQVLHRWHLDTAMVYWSGDIVAAHMDRKSQHGCTDGNCKECDV